MTKAKNMRPPTTPPAMAAIGIPLPDFDAEVVEDDVLALEVVVLVEVVGAAGVEEGERLLRQLLSSEEPTVLISELPPLRPAASTIKNIIDVP
jgi:hypothetical protein